MTGLLVSVRDRVEALAALAAGADVIDLKEPRRGSLGAVDAQTMQDVAAALGGGATLSVALGELLELSEETAAAIPCGMSFAKCGLAGCAARADWPARLVAALGRFPRGVNGVAVAYADYVRAAAPAPCEVLQNAISAGCRAVLIDTWGKDAGGLLDLWSLPACAEFVAKVRAAGMVSVVAGSLTPESIERVLPLAPDFVAVRGAACRAGRDGPLDPQLVRRLAEQVHARTAAA